MKFFVSTVVAFAAAVLAKPILTNSNFDIVEGEPFTFTWDNAQGEVTLTLKNGDPENLKDVIVITSGETGNEFTWTPENLPSDTYAIEISDASGVPNYSIPFDYEGTGTVTSSAASSAPSSSSIASSSVTSAASSSTESFSTITSAASTASASESSSSSSSTSTRTTTTRTAPATTPTNQNEGQRFSSPLALLLVTVAAVFFFN